MTKCVASRQLQITNYKLRITHRPLPIGVLLFLCWSGIAAVLPQDEPVPPTKPGTRIGRGYEMDYGSALSYTINCKVPGATDADDVVLKGVAVRVSKEPLATVCFDTESLRYAAGWTNGFLDISRTHLNSSKGSHYAFADGDVQFRTTAASGWKANSSKYHGFYRSGDEVVFSYACGGTEILDMPGFDRIDGLEFFTRTLSIAKHTDSLSLALPAPSAVIETATSDPAYKPIVKDGVLTFPPRTESIVVKIAMRRQKPPVSPRILPAQLDIRSVTKGGSPRWPQPLNTLGKLGIGTGAYVVDTLTMPEQNPWKSWLRFVAFDFFSDGRAAISTWSGDVWIVSGIDDKLANLKWKRYAAGLFEGLGLKIVDDTVYVNARDRIVRLRDLNGDGEADFYENFNSDAPAGPSYHAFSFDLQTDRAGNFYYIRCGQRVDPSLPLNGGMVKVSKDGTTAELIAHGLRAANGMAIGPNDEIICSDNQGNWTPSSRINLVKPGKFYGYVPHAHTKETPTDFEKPICWLPMTVDNSSGGETWVTSDRWGPFQNKILHTSYGKASLMLLMIETSSPSFLNGERIPPTSKPRISPVNGLPGSLSPSERAGLRGNAPSINQASPESKSASAPETLAQGGVVQFPLKFDSGIMRARFHPLDGQLYVCGLRGWQTLVARDGAFQRVRYTGKPVYMPAAIKVVHDGLRLTFTCELDRSSAEDAQNYAVEAWNYKWTEAYGSPDFSAAHPDQKGHDTIDLASVRLDSDHKTVLLKIPAIKPVMQMKVQFRIKATDGTPLANEIYNTINWVP
jgi:hypothetical protein